MKPLFKNRIKELTRQFSLIGELSFEEISPGFPVIKINNAYACATISLYGGQLLEYKPHDQSEAVIWLSDQAIYKQDKAIRGGIPICWPWFGDFEGCCSLLKDADGSLSADGSLPAHGYARITFWDIQSTQRLSDGETQIVLKMPCQKACQQYQAVQPGFDCELTLNITIGKDLKLDLMTVNRGQQIIPLSNALHSYFRVSDIHEISISGLEQLTYLDKLNDGQSYLQETELQFKNETDKVFIDTGGDIQLNDQGFNRRIIISKVNSHSTVIWNPWQEKSALMSDMSDQAWLTMVCIEPANVHKNQIHLRPGQSQQLSTLIHVEKLI